MLIVVAVVAAACTNGADSPSVTDAKVVDPAAQRYAGTVTVVETRDHGPELCVDAVSAVPTSSCRGLPVTNWRWDQIEAERSKQGTTWGTYRVAGVYDGGTFTLTSRPVRPVRRRSSRTSR